LIARSLPDGPPPHQKRPWSSASRPLQPVPRGISRRSSTSPVSGSIRRTSDSSPSHVACQSWPSTHVTPVTKRSLLIVLSTLPVFGSTFGIFRGLYWPIQSAPSAHARPESSPSLEGAGIVPTILPLFGSIFRILSPASW